MGGHTWSKRLYDGDAAADDLGLVEDVVGVKMPKNSRGIVEWGE